MTKQIYTILFFSLLLPFIGNGAQKLSINVNSTSRPTCSGLCNGSASISVSGGVAPYHFQWNSTTSDTNVISNLCEGHYAVTVSDNSGSAPISFSFNLSAPAPLNASLSYMGTPTCMGVPTLISATGGTSPYTGTGSFITPPGNNLYVVSDNNGCLDSIPVSVPFSMIQMTVTCDTACPGGTAKAIVTATGGHPPYTGVGVFEVGAGVHYFSVYDSMGCFGIDTVMVPSYTTTPVTITTNDTTAKCSGDTVQICAPRGYSSYFWNLTGSITFCTNATAAGNYYVVVTDPNNCKVESNHIAVHVRPTTPVSVALNGDTLQSFDGQTYQWFYNSQPISGANGQLVVANKCGDYTVAVTDDYGCRSMSTVVSVAVTGIENIENQSLQVYPNPTALPTCHLSVTNDLIGGSLELYNTNGQVVYKAEIHSSQTEIPLNIAKGTYIVRIQAAEKVIERQLVRL